MYIILSTHLRSAEHDGGGCSDKCGNDDDKVFRIHVHVYP